MNSVVIGMRITAQNAGMLPDARLLVEVLLSAVQPRRMRRGGRGFTLLELMLSVAVVGVLTAIAVPSYRAVVMRLEVSRAVQDLVLISQAVERSRSTTFRLPDSLGELRNIPTQDPWGQPYQYLNFATGSRGQIRKDHNLHPLNTEFDLYSMGPDGSSVPPLTGRASRDDIIFARDGEFVGKAEDF